MSWAQRYRKALARVENEQAQKVKAAGFAIQFVTLSDHEDGVGEAAGVNATRDGVWYTLRQALNEIGERTDFYALAIERGYLEE
jgi:hypothetical protein